MYNYNISYNTSYNNGSNGLMIWAIVSLVIAVIGAFVAYFIFLIQKEEKFKGFLGWLHKFLNFKTLFIDTILKITYMILAIYITLYSLGLIAVNIGLFFLTLIGGNIILRITYEMSMLLIKICQNTSEINRKLK